MPTMTSADALFADLGAVDWNDLAAITSVSDTLLNALDTDRTLLRELTERAIEDPDLLRLCEHYDILDKVILHDDPTGWRLRLHVFLPGYFDRPHNHRWTYRSRILHGSYTHTLYGTDDQLGDGDTEVTALQPRLVRTESTGDSYTLHHSMIHAVTAEPHTTSLVVRGPAVKDRFLRHRPGHGPGVVAVRCRHRLSRRDRPQADERQPGQRLPPPAHRTRSADLTEPSPGGALPSRPGSSPPACCRTRSPDSPRGPGAVLADPLGADVAVAQLVADRYDEGIGDVPSSAARRARRPHMAGRVRDSTSLVAPAGVHTSGK